MIIRGYIVNIMGVIRFHEYMLSLIGFRLPFDKFEVGILNHLLIAPFKLHLYELSIHQIFHALV